MTRPAAGDPGTSQPLPASQPLSLGSRWPALRPRTFLGGGLGRWRSASAAVRPSGAARRSSPAPAAGAPRPGQPPASSSARQHCRSNRRSTAATDKYPHTAKGSLPGAASSVGPFAQRSSTLTDAPAPVRTAPGSGIRMPPRLQASPIDADPLDRRRSRSTSPSPRCPQPHGPSAPGAPGTAQGQRHSLAPAQPLARSATRAGPATAGQPPPSAAGAAPALLRPGLCPKGTPDPATTGSGPGGRTPGATSPRPPAAPSPNISTAPGTAAVRRHEPLAARRRFHRPHPGPTTGPTTPDCPGTAGAPAHRRCRSPATNSHPLVAGRSRPPIAGTALAQPTKPRQPAFTHGPGLSRPLAAAHPGCTATATPPGPDPPLTRRMAATQPPSPGRALRSGKTPTSHPGTLATAGGTHSPGKAAPTTPANPRRNPPAQRSATAESAGPGLRGAGNLPEALPTTAASPT